MIRDEPHASCFVSPIINRKSYIVNRSTQDLASRPDLVAKINGFIKTVEKDSSFLAKDLSDCLALNVTFPTSLVLFSWPSFPPASCSLFLQTSSEQYKYYQRVAAGLNPLDTTGAEAEPLPFSKQLPFFNAQEVARQMTVTDTELFRAIRVPFPFVHALQ